MLLEGKGLQAGHHLQELFDKLDSSSKSRIEALWDENNTVRSAQLDAEELELGVKIPRDLPTALSDCGDSFKLMRYVYEDPTKPVFYITFLAPILERVIRERTEWR